MNVFLAASPPVTGEHEPEIRRLGAHVVHPPATSHLPAFLWAYWRELRRLQYDVVHVHVHHFSGVIVLLARLAGVPVRVVTSHSNTLQVDRTVRPTRRLYLFFMALALNLGVTHRTAVSQSAAQSLFGRHWRSAQIIDLGVDLDAFAQPRQTQIIRRSLGLEEGIPVLGCVAQMRPEKNLPFLLEILQEFHRQHGAAYLLLVGDGPQRQVIEQEVSRLKLQHWVCLTGSRPDVPEMLWAMDVFLLASEFEGLSLSLIEAQMAGLPGVVSDTVPILSGDERFPLVDVWKLPLSASARAWADASAQALARGRHPAPQFAFDIGQTSRQLAEFYRRVTAQARS